MGSGRTTDLTDRKILIVEDEFIIALDLASTFERCGAVVIGPATTLSAALELANASPHIDAAVLDVRLQDDLVFPVADALRRRSIPYVFTTGYGDAAIPESHNDVHRHGKPVDPEAVVRALFPFPVTDDASGTPCVGAAED
jgi:CheY-like chemotaxis protein